MGTVPQSVAPVLTLYITCRSYTFLLICTSILFGIAVFFCARARARARESRELAREGPALHEILSTVRDGLAKTRAPEPRTAQLSLCKPEKLVSPDFWRYPLGTALLFRQYPLGTVSPRRTTAGLRRTRNQILYSQSNFAAQAPTSSPFERNAKP